MTPVKQVALEHQLPVLQPEKLSGSLEMESLLSLDAEGIVTAAFGQFLPTKLLENFQFAVNVHASLLPKYRGGAPIHYALINGDDEAGVTIMEMVKEMDAGDMIAARSLPILDEDNEGTLFEKLAVLGRDLLLDSLPAYLAGEIRFYAGRSKPKNGCPFDQDNEAHRKSAGCRSWQGGSGAAKAPPEGADPAGTPEREKADEPLWRQKCHALCGSSKGF